MDTIVKDTDQRYKYCAGKGCTKEGIHSLRIKYIKKQGWFCDSCRDALVDDELTE
jgi:hypothetical protein